MFTHPQLQEEKENQHEKMRHKVANLSHGLALWVVWDKNIGGWAREVIDHSIIFSIT